MKLMKLMKTIALTVALTAGANAQFDKEFCAISISNAKEVTSMLKMTSFTSAFDGGRERCRYAPQALSNMRDMQKYCLGGTGKMHMTPKQIAKFNSSIEKTERAYKKCQLKGYINTDGFGFEYPGSCKKQYSDFKPVGDQPRTNV